MKILVADDEPLARERIISLLEEIDFSMEIEQAGNGLEVLDLLTTFDADILLLDIKMPGKDGLQVAKELSQKDLPPAIIFTTAYDKFAIEAFDTQAVAYLLKPIRKSDLAKKLNACYHLNKTQQQIVKPLQSHHQFIHISSKESSLRINLNDICYFMADQKYVQVVYYENNRLQQKLWLQTLKQLEKEFADKFIRVHHKTLVKISLLDSLRHSKEGKYLLHLNNLEVVIEVSRRHVAMVKKLLKSS